VPTGSAENDSPFTHVKLSSLYPSLLGTRFLARPELLICRELGAVLAAGRAWMDVAKELTGGDILELATEVGGPFHPPPALAGLTLGAVFMTDWAETARGGA
jgi:hypothetical protein